MPGKMYIDLTDLIIYAAHFDHISGIQRVNIELIKFTSKNTDCFQFISAFDPQPLHIDWIVSNFIEDEQVILSELNKEYSIFNLGPRHKTSRTPLHLLKIFLKRLLRRWPLKQLKFKPGDIVFVPGGFDLAEGFINFYKKIAAHGARLVFLVNDVIPVTQPDLAIAGSNHGFARAAALPAEIITTTQFNATDFERAYQIAAKSPYRRPLSIVPLAHEFPNVPRNAISPDISKRLSLLLRDRDFVLSVGTVEIRKNHITLLEIWRSLKKEFGEKLPILVIAGRRGWKAEAALAFLDQAAKHQDPVVFVEKPSDQELHWLYATCQFSVFPSLFEGWGLPVGESLWFGKPCAASRASSIPEVGKDLCIYFDPDNPEDMKAAIRQLLDPAVKKHYEDKIKVADLRSWADVAKDLTDVVSRLKEAG